MIERSLHTAGAYLWLQKDGEIPNDYQHRFVIEFIEPNSHERSYIINQEAIIDYFNKNPGKVTTHENTPLIDPATGDKQKNR